MFLQPWSSLFGQACTDTLESTPRERCFLWSISLAAGVTQLYLVVSVNLDGENETLWAREDGLFLN